MSNCVVCGWAEVTSADEVCEECKLIAQEEMNRIDEMCRKAGIEEAELKAIEEAAMLIEDESQIAMPELIEIPVHEGSGEIVSFDD